MKLETRQQSGRNFCYPCRVTESEQRESSTRKQTILPIRGCATHVKIFAKRAIRTGSEDVVGEMKGSSLCTRSSSKGRRVSGPPLWFSLDCSSPSSRLGPRSDVSRVIAAPRPVNNTSPRLFTPLPDLPSTTVAHRLHNKENSFSLLNTPV